MLLALRLNQRDHNLVPRAIATFDMRNTPKKKNKKKTASSSYQKAASTLGTRLTRLYPQSREIITLQQPCTQGIIPFRFLNGGENTISFPEFSRFLNEGSRRERVILPAFLHIKKQENSGDEIAVVQI